MSRNFFLVATPVVLAVLSGCATQPIPTSEAALVPDSRIHDRALLQPLPGTGSITVKRDSGFLGSGCNTSVYANGALIAQLAPSEKITFHMPEGKHVLSAWPNNPCGGGLTEVEASVNANKPLTYRIGSANNGGGATLYPTAF